MIKSIRFKNFYSFRDITVTLHKNENVLIGINGSGKSNFLKALHLLKEGIVEGRLKNLLLNRWGGFDNIYFHDAKSDGERSIEVEYCFDREVLKDFGGQFPDDVYYQITIHTQPSISNYYLSEQLYIRADQGKCLLLEVSDGQGRLLKTEPMLDQSAQHPKNDETNFINYPKLRQQDLSLHQIQDPERFPSQYAVQQAIKDIEVYDYFDTTPASRIRRPTIATAEEKLLLDGRNLPQILNTININFKSKFKKIVEKLHDVNEHFSDIDFHFIGGNIELMLEEKFLSKSVPVANMSDGTLRFLCLLAILYNPQRGKLICIDEPETGLHPDMILTITEAMHECSEETQLVIATHSENVLNAFKLEHIRVLEKNEKNESVVTLYAEQDFEGWYKEYVPVGKRWRQGDLGGNRW